jgi:hypothetical protein
VFEEAFLKVGERLGVLQARAILALAAAVLGLAVTLAGGVYVWLSPLALCRQQTSQLYFGTHINADGNTAHVTEAEWNSFVESAIVSRFPDGFTVHDGHGFYRSTRDGSTVREAAYILTVAHGGSRDSGERLNLVAADYKSRFRQESVLRIDQCSSYRF